MAVDISELIEPLKREMSPPGTDLFADATDDDWLGQLQDSFWEAKLYGFFEGYSEFEGFVSPDDAADDDLSRTQQQLIVLFAGSRCLRNELKNMNTKFRAAAGSVEFETENSATLLRDILKDLRSKIDLILATMSDLNYTTTTTYIDSLYGRELSLGYGDIYHQWNG